MEPYAIRESAAAEAVDWIKNRGGILVWQSVNLSNPGISWLTPARLKDGRPAPRPSWQAAERPARHITDMADVMVARNLEYKRVRISVRPGSQGLSLKLTDAASGRVRKALHEAGEGAWYRLEGNEAVIMRPTVQIPLTRWFNANSYVTNRVFAGCYWNEQRGGLMTAARYVRRNP